MVGLDLRETLCKHWSDTSDVRRAVDCRDAAKQLCRTPGIARCNRSLGQLQKHVGPDRVGSFACVV